MRLSRVQTRSRILSCILFVVLLAGFGFQQPVFAAGSSENLLYNDYIYYTKNVRGEITIKSARASVTEFVIPASIDGCPVTEIESYAFQECTRLTSLILPDTIQKIGDFAFLNCKRLENLYIPDTVEDIGWGIVNGTWWLSTRTEEYVVAGNGILLAYKGKSKNVTVPDGVRVISGYAFSNCDTVEKVWLPATLTMIDAFAFDKCQNLRSIQIQDNVQIIGQYAFHWCTSLEHVEMPDSVQRVEPHAFSYCKALETVRLSGSLQQLDTAVFSSCCNLKSVEIPGSVKTIYNYVFQECTSLESVVLPETVHEIGLGVFDGCANLKELTIQNPACRIYDNEKTIASTTKICGKISSTAQIYAQKYGCSFRATDRLRGDYDNDGEISMLDAYYVLLISSQRYAGAALELTDEQFYVCDFDQDGKISMVDAYNVLHLSSRILAGDKDAIGEAA